MNSGRGMKALLDFLHGMRYHVEHETATGIPLPGLSNT
jgi:hypothetical protein